MIRNDSIPAPTCDSAWDAEEPMVEQYYPRQMSWYAPEGPQGRIEEFARLVKERPMRAVGIAFLVGLAVAVMGAPAVKMGAGVGGRMIRRGRSKATCRERCRTV
jgi:hypothetical protein